VITVDVRSNLRQVALSFPAAARRHIRPAAARALNRVAVSTRAEASREIRQVYVLKARAIKAQIRLTRATAQSLEARLTASGKRIPLIEFQARQNRQGVSVRIKRAGGRKTVRHAFVARMRSGHVGVFLRLEPGSNKFAPRSRRRRVRRSGPDLPIIELKSLSLPKAFTNREVVAAMTRIASARFNIEFQRELGRRAATF